jgi:hypothetical protein
VKRTSIVAIVSTLALPLGGAAAATPTGSTPPENGCPASATERPVSDFPAEEGYMLPSILDAAGNNDGFICALQLPEAAAKNFPVETLYVFSENNLPAEKP